eukprot:TRINITY_DN4783_c0_g1_i9.p1 TRINITY_DN4783_c0_g1~~TRINITY_DN4783_c0_g1_i9.p1  ORF type:complete len:180 (-),score=39.73 TRINITY_DN4783_c0_g1_i9:251-790(-)
MVSETKATNFPKPFFEFLSRITSNGVPALPNYLFEFELNRLVFTNFSTLKEMTDIRRKMIITCFILVRALLYTNILRVYEVNPSYNSKPNVKTMLLTMGSIISVMIRDYLRLNMHMVPNNQVHLPVELKAKARGAYKAEDVPTFNIPKTKKGEDPEWIEGLFSKEMMPSVFEDQSQKPA